ncbi:MAG: L-lactate permease [Phycisphaeraceae bacterium]|nr:L-lactate permease [Phycisphaeraceae bacterium]
MTLVLAILPIALLLASMTFPRTGRWLPLPAHVALPAAAALAYGLRLVRPDAASHARVHAAVVEGALSSLTPLAIVFGAVLLFKTMEKSGAMVVLSAWLRRLSPDPVAQMMLVGWALSFLVEGLSGFGTPAALAAPILVGLGFPPLRIAAMCLIMNSVPVSFGAVGMPTWLGLGGVELSAGELGEIGWRTALVHAAAAPLIAVLALRVVAPWAQIRRRLLFVLAVVASSVGPYVLAARFGVEFPSIVGGLTGLIGASVLAHRRIGLPAAAGPSAESWAPSGSSIGEGVPASSPAALSGTASISIARAVMPPVATVLLLAVTRIDALGLRGLLTSESGAVSAELPGLGEAWASPAMVVGLRAILGTDADWRMPLLYVPFIIPFVAVCLAAVPVLRMSRAAVGSVWTGTVQRVARPAVALAGALVLARVMTTGGDASPVTLIGLAMADAVGGAWPFFAPLLGAMGSFFSGSNTVSNLTFAPIQAAIAGTLGLDRATILALQSAGGAMGNMVCIHNIVAVGAVLGLSEHRDHERGPGEVAAVLRLTIGPLAAYALIAAAMAWVFAVVWS